MAGRKSWRLPAVVASKAPAPVLGKPVFSDAALWQICRVSAGNAEASDALVEACLRSAATEGVETIDTARVLSVAATLREQPASRPAPLSWSDALPAGVAVALTAAVALYTLPLPLGYERVIDRAAPAIHEETPPGEGRSPGLLIAFPGGERSPYFPGRYSGEAESSFITHDGPRLTLYRQQEAPLLLGSAAKPSTDTALPALPPRPQAATAAPAMPLQSEERDLAPGKALLAVSAGSEPQFALSPQPTPLPGEDAKLAALSLPMSVLTAADP
ncbi:MAG: hypothetical protein AAGI03_13710 [Pseudomonadota bacterium]